MAADWFLPLDEVGLRCLTEANGVNVSYPQRGDAALVGDPVLGLVGGMDLRALQHHPLHAGARDVNDQRVAGSSEMPTTWTLQVATSLDEGERQSFMGGDYWARVSDGTTDREF